MRKLLLLMIGLMILTAGCGGNDTVAGKKVELHIAAAASLTDAMQELALAYENMHPEVKVVFNFGSSGALQQAIQNGGQADLFFSAAQKQMDALEKDGLLLEGTRRDLLINKLVLIVPADGGRSLTDFRQLMAEDIRYIALGEPKGVPAGQYAEEVFAHLGILEAVRAKAVYGSDVRQVLSWVESGEADCGVVYATDAVASGKVKVVAKAPAGSHTPIVYPAAVLRDSLQQDVAKDFLAFTVNEESKKVFEKYGFEVK